MVRVTTAFSAFLAGRSAEMLAFEPGVSTPRRFSDSRREHMAVRCAAGLFDFSFMGCVEITGSASLGLLHSVQTRTLSALPVGRIAYTLLLREDGSVLNDATVWRLDPDRYWLFAGRRSDIESIRRTPRASNPVAEDLSQRHAVIAVQGSVAWRTIERCFRGQTLEPLPYYGFLRLRFADRACWLARIGYSGESGYELVTADEAAPALWQALLEHGRDSRLLECGFDATDSLRIEAGHILFTRELASPVTPGELGLGRLIDYYHADYCGKSALRAQRWSAPRRRLVGLLPAREVAATEHVPQDISARCGVLTSACWSPLYERTLGLGFVNTEDARPGTAVTLQGGTRASVARLPFYDPGKFLARCVR